MPKVLIILFLSLALNSMKIEAMQCQRLKTVFCGRGARWISFSGTFLGGIVFLFSNFKAQAISREVLLNKSVALMDASVFFFKA